MSALHPGCYGLPSAVSVNSASCRACAFATGCVSAASALLESLPNNPLTRRERLSLVLTRRVLASVPPQGADPDVVTTSRRGVKRLVLGAAQLQALAGLPPRVAAQLRADTERGWFDFARRELATGRNPATKGWKKLLCAALLTGGVTRAELQTAFVEQLCMTPGSARAQVSVGIAYFAAARLASERFGRFTLTPN